MLKTRSSRYLPTPAIIQNKIWSNCKPAAFAVTSAQGVATRMANGMVTSVDWGSRCARDSNKVDDSHAIGCVHGRWSRYSD